jgi:ribose transport system permease protein
MSTQLAPSSGAGSAGKPGKSGKSGKQRIIAPPISGQEVVLLAVIAVLWVLLWLNTPAFLTMGSIRPLLIEVAPIALMGVGMTLVIIAAGIDVSVGSMMMVCGVVTAKLLVEAVTVSSSPRRRRRRRALLGAVNGALIAWGRVHPIIITFGTLNVFQWLGRQLFGSETVNGIPGTLDVFGRGQAGSTLNVHTASC